MKGLGGFIALLLTSLLLSAVFGLICFTFTYGEDGKGVPEPLKDVIVLAKGPEIKAWVAETAHATKEFIVGYTIGIYWNNYPKEGTWSYMCLEYVNNLATAGSFVAYRQGINMALLGGQFLVQKVCDIWEALIPEFLTNIILGLAGQLSSVAKEGWNMAKVKADIAWAELLKRSAENPMPPETMALVVLGVCFIAGMLFTRVLMTMYREASVKAAIREEFASLRKITHMQIKYDSLTFSSKTGIIEMSGITVTNPTSFTHLAGYLMKVNKCQVYLKPWPLLFGNVKMTRVVVEHPTLQFRPGGKSGSNIVTALLQLRSIEAYLAGDSHPPPLQLAAVDPPKESFTFPIDDVIDEEMEISGATQVLTNILLMVVEVGMGMWIEDQKANGSPDENLPDLQKAMVDGGVQRSSKAGISYTPREFDIDSYAAVPNADEKNCQCNIM